MTVTIRVASRRGDNMCGVTLQEAQEYVAPKIEQDWTAIVNGLPIESVDEFKDGDEIILLPKISGG